MPRHKFKWRRLFFHGLGLVLCLGLGARAWGGPAAVPAETERMVQNPMMQELDGARGKIFHVDTAARRFELLKETDIDPRTNEGRSRYPVAWTAQTRITKVVQQNVFSGVAGPVVAVFEALDEDAVRAVAEGTPFVTRHVRLLCDAAAAAGRSDDGKTLVAWFTPDPDNPRSGTVKLKGKTVAARLRGPRSVVEVHRDVEEQVLAGGFWETTVHGAEQGGVFTVARMEIYPLVDPREIDDPALPRVLVVGDSISMNYHEAAQAALAGIANYWRVDGNAGPSDRGVACMELWLGDYTQPGLHWDLIQFNHGLHDLKQFYDEETKTYGAYQLDLDAYKANLEKEIAIMRKTGAKLMWCSTTPVPNDSVGHWKEGTMGRRKDEDRVFNRAALEVMANHPDILVNDLNAVVRRQAGLFDEWRRGTDVHFWGRPQQEVVGKAVAEAIRQALGADGKPKQP